MSTCPSSQADDPAWDEWCQSLRPTTLVPTSVKDISLPLRVFCCETMASKYKIKLEKPKDWDFAAISHRWLNNEPWEADPDIKRRYPMIGGVMVTAVRKRSLLTLSSLCLSKGIKFFWLDCLCIDQESEFEQAREILNMGNYYSKASMTLVFPYGLDLVGPPLLPNGEGPVWHSRAWTLQEEAMAGERAVFVLYFPDGDVDRGRHESMALTTLGNDDQIQSFAAFASNLPGSTMKHKEPRRYLNLVPSSGMTSCRLEYANTSATFNDDARNIAIRVTKIMQSQQDWTLWSALREMYRREAVKEEDLIYGLLGLLGLSIPPRLITYGIRLHEALRLLVDAVHVDQRLLLTVVESYHSDFAYGHSTLPAFKDPTAVPAARMSHLRTLGVTEFSALNGMVITAPAITVDLEPTAEQVLVDVLEEHKTMLCCDFSQSFCGQRRLSKGLVKMSLTSCIRGATLIAVTQVEAPSPEIFHKCGCPLITFCCLVCSDSGSTKRKVGLALVVAVEHAWTMQKHLVA